MNNENNLGEELLKQNGMESGTLSDEDRRKLNRRIALEKKRFRRMKWFTIVSWVLVGISFILLFAFRSHYLKVLPGGLVVDVHNALALFATICTILMAIRYFRLRAANMQQIQTTLADIQNQLKSLAKKK